MRAPLIPSEGEAPPVLGLGAPLLPLDTEGTLVPMRWPWQPCETHRWFPGMTARQFLPLVNVCLRCRTHQVLLPWGECLRGHPVAEHYDPEGHLQPHPTCGAPR